MKREVVRKPLGWFKFDNVRQKVEKDVLLGKSLRRRQITPVLVKPDGTVIDGHRRVLAAQLEGLTELDCILIDEELSPSKLREIQIIAATQREGLTPYDLYCGIYEIVQCNPAKNLKDIAEELSMSAAMVTKIMAASNLVPEAMEAFKEGKLSISDQYEISQLPPVEQAETVLAKLNGEISNREQLQAVVKQRKNGAHKPVNRFKAPLPSGIEVVLVGALETVAMVEEAARNIVKLAVKAQKEGITDPKVFAALLKEQNGGRDGK